MVPPILGDAKGQGSHRLLARQPYTRNTATFVQDVGLDFCLGGLLALLLLIPAIVYIPRLQVFPEPTEDSPDRINLVVTLLDRMSFPRVGDELRIHSQGSQGDIHLDALGYGDAFVLFPMKDQHRRMHVADVPDRGPLVVGVWVVVERVPEVREVRAWDVA